MPDNFDTLIEEAALTIDGARYLANFTVGISYTTEGHMSRCRVDEVYFNPQTVTLYLTDDDGERIEDREVFIPGKDSLAQQVEAAIWANEDYIRDEAEGDLHGACINAMELARDARRDDARA